MTSHLGRRTRRRTAAVLASVASLALVVAGCGTSDDGGDDEAAPGGTAFEAPDLPMQEEVGDGEGKLNVLAWPGYAESGKNDPSVDWVTPFEKKTG